LPTPTASVAWTDPVRAAAFEHWIAALQTRRGIVPSSVRIASSDASFRRYLRVDSADGTSCIVMDAPPALQDVRPFIHVAAMLERIGLHAPRVLEQDLEHGFLLLTDLGDQSYLATLQRAPSRSRAECRVPVGLTRRRRRQVPGRRRPWPPTTCLRHP